MTEDNPHLRRTLVALLLGCALAAASTASASAAVLKADYNFSGDLSSSVLPAPSLTQVGVCPTPNNFASEPVNSVPDQVLSFDAGCGLQLDTSTVIPQGTYSIALLFRFTDVAGFARVFDSTPGLLDDGLYVIQSLVDYIIGGDHLGPDAPVQAGLWGQLVITRDAATQQVNTYFNGIPQASFTDPTDVAAISAAQTPRFFIDDTNGNSGGAVSRLRLWDAPLTPTEVAALDGNAKTDVSITTTGDIDPAFVGLPLDYSIVVSNPGPTARGVVVSDELPAGVDFVSASPGCSEVNHVVACAVGTQNGSPTVLHIIVQPNAVDPALTNTATVTTTSADVDPTNNSSTVTTDVRLQPSDVSITTTDDVDPAFVGLPLSYSIVVSAAGSAASGVVVTDTLPAGVDFVSAPGCSELNRVVTCDVGALSGGPTVLQVTVRPTAVNPTLSNTATVTTTSTDADPANNTSTATTDVRAPADLSVAMAGDVAATQVGQTIGYSISVANHGPGAAQSVVVTDTLSADVDFVSASPGCVASAGLVTCDFGTMALGASASRRIVVRPTAPDTQLVNTATVQSITGDVNLDNNFATTLTAVHPPLGLPVAAAAPTTTPPGSSAPVAPPPAVVAPIAQAGTKPLGKPVVAATTRRGLLRSGLRFTQRFATAGSVRWTLTLPASGKTKAVVLGSATRTLTESGSVSVTLKLGSAGRRRLAGKRATTLTLRTSFKPAGQSRHAITTAIVRLRG